MTYTSFPASRRNHASRLVQEGYDDQWPGGWSSFTRSEMTLHALVPFAETRVLDLDTGEAGPHFSANVQAGLNPNDAYFGRWMPEELYIKWHSGKGLVQGGAYLKISKDFFTEHAEATAQEIIEFYN